VKLAVVVQRYGADINGGAELHARYVAEHLARHHEVEVLTTCARDYVTWRNEWPSGPGQVHGVTVRRFPVARERVPDDFGRRSALVFGNTHSVQDEIGWLESEGPASPALIRHLSSSSAGYDYVFFFSARYYHAYHGARAAAGRAILVPTAEREPAVGVSIFAPVFRGVRALMYNSFEERAMIHAVSGNQDVPGVVVGIGSDVPQRTEPGRARQEFALRGRYVVYVGRIDENKGCNELFRFFQGYVSRGRRDLTLVLVGHSILPIPDHPRIRHLGFLDDRDKFDLVAGAELLIMPSYFESLSMVALEAWALGRPVLANGKCDVLRGQCVRSGAGLYYESFEEFVETLHAIESNPQFNEALGRNGRDYFRRHYAWPVIEQKYLDMLNRLAADDRAGTALRAMEPLPGWFARRRRTCPPAAEVLARVPAGPVLPEPRGPRRGQPGRRTG
jgi:glycosyltransferase involved in cell wall biosynthesis